MKQIMFWTNQVMSLSKKLLCRGSVVILVLLGMINMTFAQNDSISRSKIADSDDLLLNQYIQSQGKEIIVFDTFNIKQYWIDNSIVSNSNSFVVNLPMTTKEQWHESIPLKIQLINVNESQNCKVEIIAESTDFEFSISNNQNVTLSKSDSKESFLHYTIVSSSFQLERTSNFSFCLKLISQIQTSIPIKKIILSFSKNQQSSYLSTPGVLSISNDKLSIRDNADGSVIKATEKGNRTISVTGRKSSIVSTNKILVLDNTLMAKIKIKNIGTEATRIYIGYAAYNSKQLLLDGRYYPYSDSNKSLNVLSSDGNKIIVDAYPKWSKNCFLAYDINEDMSDVPNYSLSDGRIIDIRKVNEKQIEIILDKTPKTQIKSGSKIRVHGLSGDYFYTQVKTLMPGEEETFSSNIKKDNDCLYYLSKSFPKGTYYVKPLILSYSVNPNIENTILISDFTVSY